MYLDIDLYIYISLSLSLLILLNLYIYYICVCVFFFGRFQHVMPLRLGGSASEVLTQNIAAELVRCLQSQFAAAEPTKSLPGASGGQASTPALQRRLLRLSPQALRRKRQRTTRRPRTRLMNQRMAMPRRTVQLVWWGLLVFLEPLLMRKITMMLLPFQEHHTS